MLRLSKRLILSCGIGIAVAALLAAYLILTAPVRKIHRFLDELSEIEVGTSTLEDFRKKLDSDNLKSVSFACQGAQCTASERSEVNSISRLRLAPPSVIVASVGFENGVASEIYVWLEIEDRNMEPGTGATIHESRHSNSCPQHFCTYVNERRGYPWAVVELDAAAPEEGRRRAFALNTGCLTKLGGCKSPEMILPKVFGKHAR